MKLIKIGRSKECDIIFENDTKISRLHAEFFKDNDENIFLTDLNSSNGTFVNGKKITDSVIIKNNDIVKIGNTVIPWENYFIEKNISENISKTISFEPEEPIIQEENNHKNSENKINIFYILASIIIAGIMANSYYKVNDVSIILEILGFLFLPTLLAFLFSIYTKLKFEIVLTASSIAIMALQLVLFN